MNVRFEVDFISMLPVARQWVIDGRVRNGVILQGSELIVEELDETVKVENIALVNVAEHDKGRLTIAIAEPRFDFYLIVKGMTLRSW